LDAHQFAPFLQRFQMFAKIPIVFSSARHDRLPLSLAVPSIVGPSRLVKPPMRSVLGNPPEVRNQA
jgi:hypothetical protein